ncbi:MAG: radical SAM protein [Bacillota bacterium]|nr:radical SAM protein [Bacillota bacterium]
MQQNEMDALLRACRLCPRSCAANRLAGEKGVCGCDSNLQIARAALHMWEEPCISGEEGSGTVFFAGCALGCVFCQNRKIARARAGRIVSRERLVEIFFALQQQGANNINLVTAGHYIPQVALALQEARAAGLCIPVVYNSGGYELPESLKLLDGLVDIYLPDLKYASPALSQRYAHAEDYFPRACAALEEMFRQAGEPVFDERGILQRGMVVRHLALPGQGEDSKAILRYLWETYGDRIYISLMSQYTPLPHCRDFPELQRKLSDAEYEELIDYAVGLGIENGFIQEGDAAEESFIPAFDCSGV